MDFWLDIGIAVILRSLAGGNASDKWRPAFLKVFRAIADAYRNDAEFNKVFALSRREKPTS